VIAAEEFIRGCYCCAKSLSLIFIEEILLFNFLFIKNKNSKFKTFSF